MTFPAPSSDKKALEEGAVFTPKFDAHGLIVKAVNVGRLAEAFEAGGEVTPATLRSSGLAMPNAASWRRRLRNWMRKLKCSARS